MIERISHMDARKRVRAFGTFCMAVLCAVALAGAVPARAWAVVVTEGTSVLYVPQSWAFTLSVSGSGSLVLQEVRTGSAEPVGLRAAGEHREGAMPEAAMPGLTVRNGSLDVEVPRDSTLMILLAPDEGARVAGLSLAGEDTTGMLGADSVYELYADDAQGVLEVVFSEGSAAKPSEVPSASDWLPQTGDGACSGIFALLVALACALAVLSRRRFAEGDSR